VSAVVEPAAILAGGEVVDSFRQFGITAFTTGRAAGTFGMQSDEPAREVMARWSALRTLLGGHAVRLATAAQVHGREVSIHAEGWRGWLRGDAAVYDPGAHQVFSSSSSLHSVVLPPIVGRVVLAVASPLCPDRRAGDHLEHQGTAGCHSRRPHWLLPSAPRRAAMK